MTILWWIRRDLRLHDNPALHAAAAEAHARRVPLLPLFFVDPVFASSPFVAERRWAFMLASLRALDEQLRAAGSRLIVRHGTPKEVISSLSEALDGLTVFTLADVSPLGRSREESVASVVDLRLRPGLGIRPPDLVAKADGDPYMVYTPFSRAWKALPLPGRSDLLPRPERLPAPGDLASEGLPDRPDHELGEIFPAGEAAARERLEQFAADAIYRYGTERNRLDLSATSALSPYLRFGVLSPREAAVAAIEARAGATTDAARLSADTWLNELIWRDFYLGILRQFPRVRAASFRSEYDRLRWREDPEGLAAWQEGKTGYPAVDAAMRQLAETGWMHNRGRMVVASFLVKDLLIDWREGERWFMQHLLDGDPASNNGGWQWSAGTGTDAAPYFRVFNPSSQARKFDPAGTYIRRHIPELGPVPDAYIHEPWRMPATAQNQVGVRIGHDYPWPIVDHAEARKRALAAFAEARDAT